MQALEKPIPECEICSDMADETFEASQSEMIGEIATKFLEYVIRNHTGELLLLAEKYVPIFMSKRALR